MPDADGQRTVTCFVEPAMDRNVVFWNAAETPSAGLACSIGCAISIPQSGYHSAAVRESRIRA